MGLLDGSYRLMRRAHYPVLPAPPSRADAGFMPYAKPTRGLIASTGNYACWQHSHPFGRYVIFYEPLTDDIDIVRVIHSARDIDSVFDPDSDLPAS
jgi:hypothetical protein